MILRLSSSAQRGGLVLAASFVAVLLSYFGIRNARADYFSGLQTLQALERATQLEPRDARNWYLLGRYWQFNLEDADAEKAVRAYKIAVSIDSRSTVSWLGLGSAYESAGDPAHAREAFLQAKKVYPLSAEVAWQYGNFLLRQGELDSAFTELRRAVESDPKRGAEAFSRAFRVEPDVTRILNRALPSLRDVYVDIIWDQITDGHTDNALKVWDRLASIHPTLRIQDAFTLFGALHAQRRIADASRVWAQAALFAGMSDLQGPRNSVLWDGGFESGVFGGGFSWTLPDTFGSVQVRTDSAEKHSGNRSLRMTFDGKSNVNFLGACHYVPVQPSAPYRFLAWVRTRGITTDQGIRFQLRALDAQDTSVVITPDVRGTQPWTQITTPWTSGKDVFEMQVCLLRFATDQADSKIEGTAWVDDVALVPDSPELTQP